MPDADAVNAPPGALLRADNMVLDEQNILSLRLGSSKIHIAGLPDPIHSLFTIILSGVRHRMWGSADKVYANEVDLGVSFSGSGDIHFGSHMGEILMARGASNYKYDGSTVNKWGIAMDGGAPTAIAADGVASLLISGDAGESPALVWVRDNGAGAAYGLTLDLVADGAAILFTSSTVPHLGVLTKTFAAPVDLTVIDGVPTTDDSQVRFNVYMADALKVAGIQIDFDINDGLFTDYYAFSWFGPTAGTGSTPPNWDYQAPDNWYSFRHKKINNLRVGFTPGLGWNAVKAIRITISSNIPAMETRFDHLDMAGGYLSPITGRVYYKYVYVRDNGKYVATSTMSPASIELDLVAQSAIVTVPEDPFRDPQVNKIWLFRMGAGITDGYLRVAVADVVGTGAVVIEDLTSDADALVANIKLESSGSVPPENIIDIEGPYYDRTFALTAEYLYPSRRFNPDNFADGQVIRVAAIDEVALWVRKSFGGLYIGTTKDIYRLEGTGAELPDGVIDFVLSPLNIDYPPLSSAVAQDGNFLVYLAANGWRSLAGAGSQSISGGTSLLYQGQDRHGVSGIDVFKVRFRATISRGRLAAITPEGSTFGGSSILYRHDFQSQRWYRHTYSPVFQSIFREPDGTLIAGAEDGFVRALDRPNGGDQDDGVTIPATIWTPGDNAGLPYSPKVAANLSLEFESGEERLSAHIHLDESNTPAKAVSGFNSSMKWLAFNILSINDLAWDTVQLRLTGAFNRLRLSAWALNYQALPAGIKAWDSGPMDLAVQDQVWVREVQLKVWAMGDLDVTPYFDGEEFPSSTISVGSYVNRVTTFSIPIGRGFMGRVPRVTIESDCPFHPYWVEFRLRGTTEDSEKQKIRIPSGLGGEAQG
jgi:hypothetical protein